MQPSIFCQHPLINYPEFEAAEDVVEAAGLEAEDAEESDQRCWTLTSVINLMSN